MTVIDKSDSKNLKVVETFENAIEAVGTGCFQYKLIVIGGFVILSSYLSTGIIAFVLPAAQCDLNMNSAEKGRLASASFAGIMLTCHMWGFLSDTLGRRYILIRCLFVDGLLYLITILVPNYYIILVIRLMNGFTSCGGIVSIYAYIGEFQTNKFRSLAIMIASLIASLGYFLLPVLAYVTLQATWHFELYPGLIFKPWRLYYSYCSIASLCSAFLLYFLPESPKYFLAKGETDKAIKILRQMYNSNKNGEEFKIKYLIIDDSERVSKLEENRNKIIAFIHLMWNQTAPLMKKPYRLNLFLLCSSLYLTFFLNGGVYMFLPTTINKMVDYKETTGIRCGTICDVLQYKDETLLNVTSDQQHNTICKDHVNPTTYNVFLILGSFQVLSFIIIVPILKFLNKKYFVMFITTCGIIVSGSILFSNDLMWVPVKLCAVIIITGATFPIINSIAVDLFPTSLRAMAGCLALMTSRLGTVSTLIIAGLLIDDHCYVLFWIYFISFPACVLAVTLLPSRPPTSFVDKKSENEDNV